MKLRRALLVLVATLVVFVGAPAETEAAISPNWAAPGPHPVSVVGVNGTHTLFFPTDLGANGTPHPVIIWGNGTFANPYVYTELLQHLASWGFIVAAANTAWAGSGQEMLAGATYLIDENATPGSFFYQKVDTAHIGASGHSQGGGGAINAGADLRVTTVVPIQPAPGEVEALKGPALFLAGQWDILVWPSVVWGLYNRTTHVPAVYGELARASHLTPLGNAGGYRGAVTAWFRFWLAGDEQARGEFFGPTCGLCADPAWSARFRNALALAISGP